MNESEEVRIPVARKLFARATGYEEALKRITGSGTRAHGINDAHFQTIISPVESDRPFGRQLYDYDDDHRPRGDDDDAHLTPADQLDPTFRSRLSRARKAPTQSSETTDPCRST